MPAKARKPVESPTEAKTEETPSPLQGADSNQFALDILDLAAAQMPVDESLLSIDGGDEGGKYDFPNDDESGKYDFPNDDTRKQQQDALPELRAQHAGTPYEDVPNGKAFVQGAGDENAVDPNDVAQGSLGDCYLNAGMIAVARANPEAIKKLIKDNGDGTFDVTLYIRESAWGRPKPVTKTVDARLPMKNGRPLYSKTGDKEGGETELWSALIEKTVAQHKGSYEQIEGGNIAKGGFQFHGATELLTGKTEGYFATAGMSEDDALLHIAIALEERKPVTCDSKEMGSDPALTAEATKQNVYGNHAYAPFAADLDGRTISLTNPWGSSHVTDLTVKDFLRFYRGIRVGA